MYGCVMYRCYGTENLFQDNLTVLLKHQYILAPIHYKIISEMENAKAVYKNCWRPGKKSN